jgi:selenocysteine lyase/cysteine desulfurase
VGILYGKYDLLEQLTAYKVRPAPGEPPGKFQTGTPNFEGIAGLLGSLEYLEWLGEKFGGDQSFQGESYRRLRLKQALQAISSYESTLSAAMLEILEETPGVTVYGPREIRMRVPTFSFNLQGLSPQQVAAELGKREIYVWDGNYYAVLVTEALGLEKSGGMVRVGPVHYNTLDEIQRFGEVLVEIAALKADNI